MNYKNIAIIALLLPLTITSYSKSVETRIKELEEAQFKKELEISELGEIIDKRCASLNAYKSRALYHYWKPSQEKKINDLQKKNLLSKEECTKARSDIETSFNQFIKNTGVAFSAAKDIQQLIEKEAFDQDSLEDLRIVLLRVILEQHLIEKLVEKFKICIQELTKINQELTNFKK